MGALAILKNNIWCMRMQREFEVAVRLGDEDTYESMVREGVNRALKGGLSARQLKSLKMAIQANQEGIGGCLVRAFKRGVNRDPKVPWSLSNALDEVLKEGSLIVKGFKYTS